MFESKTTCVICNKIVDSNYSWVILPKKFQLKVISINEEDKNYGKEGYVCLFCMKKHLHDDYLKFESGIPIEDLESFRSWLEENIK